jgi:hypothetical protein
MARKIYEIANDIRKEWKNISPYAKPYLNAMSELSEPTNEYYCDSAKSVVLYFLANATTFRGGRAKELKQELKNLFNI